MKCLIVVDFQNDFITGSLGTKEAQNIVENVQAKIQEYVDKEDKVIFTRDTHFKNYLQTNEGKHLPVEHCLYGTKGWQIHSEVYQDECVCIDKSTFGSIELAIYIKEHGFDEIELIGLCTSICVVTNALLIKTYNSNIEVTVDASCCACVTPESHEAALTTMKMCQINVIGE